jgi:hypothetical protein
MADINLAVTPHEVVRLSVNGRLEAEILVGCCETRDDMLARLKIFNCLTAIPRIVADLMTTAVKIRNGMDEGKTPDGKQREFCVGLADGMARKLIEHSAGGVPGYPPSTGNSYDAGYSFGDALRRCNEQIAALTAEAQS